MSVRHACGAENPETIDACGTSGGQLERLAEGASSQSASAPQTDVSAVTPHDLPPGGYRVARMRDRLTAAILDGTFLIAACAVTGMVAANRIHHTAEKGFSIWSAWVVPATAAALAAGILYFWVCEGLFGATLGKALAGIQVRTIAGGRCGLRASLVRNLLRIVDGLGIYLFGFIVILFSSSRQRLGDQVAGTVVVEHKLSRAARVALIAAWFELFTAGLAAAFLLTRSAVVPESENVRLLSPIQTPAPASLPGPLHALDLEFLKEKNGLPRPASPYKPGDAVHLRYDLGGYAMDASGRPKLLISAVVADPNGLPLERLWTGTFRDLPQPGSPLRGTFDVTLPSFAPAGIYKVIIHVYDQIRNTDLQMAPAFEVRAAATLAYRSFELRDFQLSLSRDGPAMEQPVVEGAGTVYMRSNLFGLEFRGDQVNARVALRVLSPSGRIVFDQPNYASINASAVYHPPAFCLPVFGRLSVPASLEKGIYTEQYTFVDNIANREIRQEAQFEVR